MVKEHKLTDIPVGDIKFDGDNPNRLTEEQEEALKKSFEEFGYISPIVIDQNNVVADGEHRVLLAKKLGMKTIQGYKINLESEAKRKMLRQIMNKLRGTHDDELDALEFKKIIDAGLKDDLINYAITDDKEINKLIDLGKEVTEDEFEPPKEPKYKIQRGDIYGLGPYVIIDGKEVECEVIEG